jgi:hypothetical protein
MSFTTGKRAFEGADVSDTLASVLRAEPDWHVLPRDTSPTLRTLIQRCLAKDRARRIGDMSVVKFLLSEPAFTATTSSQPRSRVRTTLLIAAVVLLSLAAGGALVWKLRPPAAAAPVMRFPIDLPEGQTFNSNQRPNIAVSRDGTRIVYASNSRLYYRSISELEAHPIMGTESTELVGAPVFSPDGRAIAFNPSGIIKTVPVEGGTPVIIGTTSGVLSGINWTTEGIVFADADPLTLMWMRGLLSGFRLTEASRSALVTVKDDDIVYGPQILPGGQSVLFTVGSRRNLDAWDQAKIVVQSLKTGERKTLIDGGSDARYLPSGHLICSVSGTVWAVPFDLPRQTVSGKGAPVIQGVRRGTYSPATQLAVSDTGPKGSRGQGTKRI